MVRQPLVPELLCEGWICMRNSFQKAVITGLCLAFSLTGCMAAKVAGMPVKAVWFAGKGLYITGKGVYQVGEGVYKVGSATVRITQRAMNTTSELILLTTRVLNAAGAVVETSKIVRRAELDLELAALQGMRNVVEVIIDIPESADRFPR